MNDTNVNLPDLCSVKRCWLPLYRHHLNTAVEESCWKLVNKLSTDILAMKPREGAIKDVLKAVSLLKPKMYMILPKNDGKVDMFRRGNDIGETDGFGESKG